MSANRKLHRSYEHLWWHRYIVVESIRLAAWRCKRHRDAIRSRLNMSTEENPESCELIFKSMAAELDMENTDLNRQSLVWASRSSWEVYMCLLHAAVTNYRDICRGFPNVAYTPLDEHLNSNSGMVVKLRTLRDKLLHPQNESDYYIVLGELGHTAQQNATDLFVALDELQEQLDGFLEHLNVQLLHSLKEEVDGLSIGERTVYRQKLLLESRNRAKSTGNAEETLKRDRYDQGVENNTSYQNLLIKAPILSQDRLAYVELLVAITGSLMAPFPRKFLSDSTHDMQTPVYDKLAASVLLAGVSGNVVELKKRMPDHVMRNRRGILDLLIRSLVIFNESYTPLIAEYQTVFPGKPLATIISDYDLFKEAIRRTTPSQPDAIMERAMLWGGVYLIAQSLLAEPLRIYLDARASNPQLPSMKINSSQLHDA